MNEPQDLLLSWVTWHQACIFLKQDIMLLEAPSTDDVLKLPAGYAKLFRFLGNAAAGMEKASQYDLRKAGVQVLGSKKDRDEYFVFWRQRGKTNLFRIDVDKLQREVQLRLDDLAMHMFDNPPLP